MQVWRAFLNWRTVALGFKLLMEVLLKVDQVLGICIVLVGRFSTRWILVVHVHTLVHALAVPLALVVASQVVVADPSGAFTPGSDVS